MKLFNCSFSRRCITSITFGLMLSAATVTFGQSGDHADQNPSVFAPGSKPYGLSYGGWSARWWQWLLPIPPALNPNLDTTGVNCAQGQAGPVWFLAGTFGGSATRTCTV